VENIPPLGLLGVSELLILRGARLEAFKGSTSLPSLAAGLCASDPTPFPATPPRGALKVSSPTSHGNVRIITSTFIVFASYMASHGLGKALSLPATVHHFRGSSRWEYDGIQMFQNLENH
jgi:hypothetical protein